MFWRMLHRSDQIPTPTDSEIMVMYSFPWHFDYPQSKHCFLH